MLQYNLDPYIFIGDTEDFIVYVEELIFQEKDESDIHYLAINIFVLGVDLEQEEDAYGFLGVNL